MLKKSVHLADMPEVVDVDKTLLDKWNTLMDLRDDVNRALEQARNEKVIGKSLEAKVIIGNNESFKATEFLQEFNDLQQLFIVSQVKLLIQLKMALHTNMVTFVLNMLKVKNVKDVGTIAKN